MTYYIRYVLTDDEAVTLAELEQALQLTSTGYEIDGDTVVLDNEDIGLIEMIGPGDDLFVSDLELLSSFAQQKRNKAILQTGIQNAMRLVFVQAIWSLGHDGTLKAIQPLFDWLLVNRSGFLVDEGGLFYNNSGLLD